MSSDLIEREAVPAQVGRPKTDMQALPGLTRAALASAALANVAP
jgi:hypothetical protein